MRNKIHFMLGRGVYPYKVGGMEIFNYYLIDSLKDKFNISYLSTSSLSFSNCKWSKLYNLKPEKWFTPLQLLLNLLLNPSRKRVVISFSDAHWIVWFLYTLVNTLLGRDYYVIIHFGDTAPDNSYKIYKKFFSKAKKIIAVSQDIKNNYDVRYGLNCEVIYPLVPFTVSTLSKEELRKEYCIPTDANIICMVGSIKPMKHPETVLEAVAKFSNEELERYNIHIIYAGSGKMVEELKERTDKYNLGNRVHFLGFVPKENVNKIFRMSDIYTIASDFEGTSVSLLEAMFNKLPIIASDAPGINDMVKNGESALFFKTNDSDELKKQIKIILENPETAKKISDCALREYNSKYSYSEIVNRYTTIFNA